MKRLLLALCVVFASGGLSAQKLVWQPSPGHTQVPIWPGAMPDAQPVVGPENTATETKELVAGMPWVYVGRVSRPTMTVYAPKEKNTGAAVVVFPGGGYQILAVDLEGTEVCDWLTSKGITCVLLKYRVPGEGGYPKSAPYPKSGPYPESPMALEDAQRTMGLVRFHAAEWHIDPHKIGVLGFSAGGHLSAAISAHFAKRLYPAVDAADIESCRPDFAVSIYPGHLSLSAAEWDAKQGTKKFVVRHPANADKELALNPDVPVTSQTPPTFLLQAEDDHVDNVDDSLAYYIALKKAGVPVEMHLYAPGRSESSRSRRSGIAYDKRDLWEASRVELAIQSTIRSGGTSNSLRNIDFRTRRCEATRAVPGETEGGLCGDATLLRDSLVVVSRS